MNRVQILAGCCFVLVACGKPSGGSDAGPGGQASTAGDVAFFSGGTTGAYTIVADFVSSNGGTDNISNPCDAPVGSCTYCSGTGHSTGSDTLVITPVGAGTITFDDDSNTLVTIPYSSTAGDYEDDSNSMPTLAWSSGDTLSATATGGMIPAFSANITAPQDIAGLNPALSLGTSTIISTSTAFVISWTPSSDNGSMKLVLSSDVSTEATIGCTVNESAGSITVAASLLQKLASGGGTASITKTVSKPVSVTGVTTQISAAAPQVIGSTTLGP